MPSLTAHQSARICKLLLIGDSGTGKTAALASLVAAGYKLRILDFDNGLDSLVQQISAKCPDKIGNVEFVTLRDKFKASPAGPIIDGVPQAFVRGLSLLDNWTDGDTKLGSPASWGDDCVLVIDSLTFLSNSAMAWAEIFKPSKDRRQIFGEAQRAVESMLGLLTSEHFRTNVIVISHITYLERDDGTKKGYPTAVGQALSPKIAAYFNSVALAETVGTGDKVQRTIRTAPTTLIDLKNPASFKMAAQLPIDTALATFFSTVKGQSK